MQGRIAALVCLSFVATSGSGQVPAQPQDHAGEAASMGRTPPRIVNLCEALQSAVALNMSEVVIRGYYRFGMELGGLYGRNCPKKLIIDGKERLQAFYLNYQRGVDDAELAAAVHKMIAEKDIRSAILVTVTGTLEAASHVWTENIGPLQIERQGRVFGHMGVYPAQIKVGSYRDVVLIDAPEFRSNLDPGR
jgi:hypothetical protein